MPFSRREPGTRVGAVLSANADDGFRLLGFGVYEGELVPPRPVGMQASLAPEAARRSWEDYIAWYREELDRPDIELEQIQIRNPCIKLDSGVVVWGAECWWGDEDVVRRKIEQSGYELIEVDPRTVRGLLAHEGE